MPRPASQSAAGDGALDPEELDEALRFVGLFLDKRELSALARSLDTDGSGRVSLRELMHALLGVPSDRRVAHATKVWAGISSGAGAVSPEAVLGAFRAGSHVDVVSGRSTADDVAGALAEELAECAGDSGDRLDEGAVVSSLLQWGAAVPSDDMFCSQLEDCFGVAEGDLGRDDASRLEGQIAVIRSKAAEKKAGGQTIGFWLAGVCKHFDGADCGGLTAGEFGRVLERLGLPLSPAQAALLFRAFGGARGAVPDAPGREPRVPWQGFVDNVVEGQTW